jgi:serine/threonine protein kinase
MLIDECKTTWDLRHYAIPAMRDLIKMDDGRVLLVMSYIPGPTLEQLVNKIGRIDPEHVSWITERILNACMYLHRNGVVHGDIKPQNVIVQPDKHMAVLVDYGLSMVKPTSKDESKGYTPFFAAPEAISGKPLIPESDYYSIGMTMVFSLSGGTDYVERKVVPTDVPDELCAFIKRMIARSVDNRPQYPKEDVVDTFIAAREKAFGRRRSNLKPITGI